MPTRKAASPLTEPAALIASVARLEERVDNFHEHTFPDFCAGVSKELKDIKGTLDKAVLRNGDFDKVKVMAEEWEKSNLRKEGAITVLRLSWRLFAWAAAVVGGTGGVGGVVVWTLGRLTGHI
jgi:hypothetical protein